MNMFDLLLNNMWSLIELTVGFQHLAEEWAHWQYCVSAGCWGLLSQRGSAAVGPVNFSARSRIPISFRKWPKMELKNSYGATCFRRMCPSKWGLEWVDVWGLTPPKSFCASMILSKTKPEIYQPTLSGWSYNWLGPMQTAESCLLCFKESTMWKSVWAAERICTCEPWTSLANVLIPCILGKNIYDKGVQN